MEGGGRTGQVKGKEADLAVPTAGAVAVFFFLGGRLVAFFYHIFEILAFFLSLSRILFGKQQPIVQMVFRLSF